MWPLRTFGVRAILTSSAVRRRLVLWLIVISIGFGRTKRKRSRRGTAGWLAAAFRLDKKLQYKLDRPEEPGSNCLRARTRRESASGEAQRKGAENAKGQAASAKSSVPPAGKTSAAANGKSDCWSGFTFSRTRSFQSSAGSTVSPSEEPFKSASPRVVHHSDPEFETTDKQFEALE